MGGGSVPEEISAELNTQESDILNPEHMEEVVKPSTLEDIEGSMDDKEDKLTETSILENGETKLEFLEGTENLELKEEIHFSKEEEVEDKKHDVPNQQGWNSDKTRYSFDGKTYSTGRVLIDKTYYLFDEEGYLVKNSFLLIGNNVYYGDDLGKPVSGFRRIGDKLYYFNPTFHLMLSNGIAHIYGVDYLFRKDGSILEEKGWIKEDGRYYYLSTKGVLRGKQKIGSHTYWFEDNGALKPSGFVKESGYDYYIKEDGSLASGFTRIEGKLYYFNPTHFFMLKNGIANIYGKNYLFKEDGSILEGKGWFQKGKSSYYLLENGKLASGFERIDGKLYYFNPVYHFRLEDGLATIHGYQYLFRKDGSILEGKGWIKEEGIYYYLSTKGILTGKQEIGRKAYVFNDKGQLQTATWFKQGNITYYALDSGELVRGFYDIEGKKYYFNPVYHFRLENGVAQIYGKHYLFRKDGSILEGKGFVKEEGNTYYIDEQGIRIGLVQIEGKEYYFDKNGILRDFGFFKNGGLTYFLTQEGKLASGWFNYAGKKYYFNPVKNFMLAGGEASIYGKTYFFGNDGAIVLGWYKKGESYYYYHSREGYQYRNGSFRVDGFLRLFDETGRLMEKSGLVKVNGKFYFVDEKGYVKVSQVIEHQGKRYILGSDGVALVDRYMLNIPALSQRPWLPTGCEITAVTMMMKTKNKSLDLISLAHEMPRSYNPYLGYVGNPFTTAGWTIYPEALEGMVRKYTGSYKNLTGADNETIKAQLMIDRPVVAWVKLHGFSVHAITLVGFSADGFFYNDPWTGEKNVVMPYWQFNQLNGLQQRRLLSY